MKRLLHCLRTFLKALILIILIFFLLPFIGKNLQGLFFNQSVNANTISRILSRNMEASQKLETVHVSDEGIAESHVDAWLIGQVQQVVIHYQYEASIGIDLRKITVLQDDNRIQLIVPPLEILTDSLTPLQIERNDFWFPLTENRRQQILEEEKKRCRTHYLEKNDDSRLAWEYTEKALTDLILLWTDTLESVELSIIPSDESQQVTQYETVN